MMSNRVALPTPILSQDGRDSYNVNSSRNSLHSSEGGTGSGLPTMILGNNTSTSIPAISSHMTFVPPATHFGEYVSSNVMAASHTGHIMTPPPGASQSLNGSAAVDPSYRNLYISGLPFSIRDDELRHFFSNFGKIESAKVMIDVSTGMSRGFAFVLFNKVEEGFSAFGSLNGKDVTIKGETFRMKMMPSEHDGHCADIPCETIYVRNIPTVVSEAEVRAHFAKFGTVVSYSTRPIEHPHQNRNHGMNAAGTELLERLLLATVQFATPEEAKQAIDSTHQLHPFSVHGTIPVLSKFADTKQAKDARKAKRTRDRTSNHVATINSTSNTHHGLPTTQLAQMVPYPMQPAQQSSFHPPQSYGALSHQSIPQLLGTSANLPTPSSSMNVNLSAFSTASGRPQQTAPSMAGITVGSASTYNQDLSGLYASQLMNSGATTTNNNNIAGYGNQLSYDMDLQQSGVFKNTASYTPPVAHTATSIGANSTDSIFFFQGLVCRTSEGLLMPVQIQQFHPLMRTGPSAPDAFAMSTNAPQNVNGISRVGQHHPQQHVQHTPTSNAYGHPHTQNYQALDSSMSIGQRHQMVMLPQMGAMYMNE